MSDMNVPPLDADVRALVESTREASVAPADVKARVLARVESVVLPPGGGGGGYGGIGATSMRAGWVRSAIPLAASFVLGAVVGAIAMRVSIRPPGRDASEAAPAGTVDLASATWSGANAVVATTGSPVPAIPPSSAHGEATLEHAHEALGAQPAVRETGLSAERALLDAARGALEREDGAAALASTNEHQRRFPEGILAQEREAMAVRALAMLGRTDEARARAVHFRARFPGSVLTPALESSIGLAPETK
jgi:hypothetical protein